MKNVSLRKKIVMAFVIIDIMLAYNIFIGYFVSKAVYKMENPTKSLSIYGIWCIVMFLISAVIMTIITYTLLKTIRVSIEAIRGAESQILEGKIEHIKLEKYANDEFGEIIDVFKLMSDNMVEQARIVQTVADGDLTINIKPKSNEDLMGNSLEKLVTRNHHALVNIRDAAYQVMTSASQVASASEALAQGSTEQASAIEEITASIDDITVKTKQNAVEAENAAKLMGNALEDVKVGNQQMNDMIKAMTEINAASESISKIIKVIDDIAFQTNILALNAAVEAARAGDAGMGFAVVAEEVRNLAAKSAAAAAETADMIEDSIRKVHSGSEIAEKTAKALELISEVVNESEQIVSGIADSSNYQATAISQIDQAVEQVSQVVQSNSSTSEECAAASKELSGQADRMKGLLAVYKFDDNSYNYNMSLYNQSYDFGGTKSLAVNNRNEQIISLTDGFGKY